MNLLEGLLFDYCQPAEEARTVWGAANKCLSPNAKADLLKSALQKRLPDETLLPMSRGAFPASGRHLTFAMTSTRGWCWKAARLGYSLRIGAPSPPLSVVSYRLQCRAHPPGRRPFYHLQFPANPRRSSALAAVILLAVCLT